jgi:hypothetical protein
MDEMTEKDWDRLFDLIEQVVNGPGPWQEKAQAVRAEAQARGAETALEEFGGWFAE